MSEEFRAGAHRDCKECALTYPDGCGCTVACSLSHQVDRLTTENRELKDRVERLSVEVRWLRRGIATALGWLNSETTPDHGKIVRASQCLEALNGGDNG